MNQLFYFKYWLYWISTGRADLTLTDLTPDLFGCRIPQKYQSILSASLKIGSVGRGKSLHSTAYLPTPPIIVIPVSPMPIICILYLLRCVTSTPLSGLLSCDISQSLSCALNFSHLSLSGHSVFVVALGRVVEVVSGYLAKGVVVVMVVGGRLDHTYL